MNYITDLLSDTTIKQKHNKHNNKKSFTILDFPNDGLTSGRFISTSMTKAAYKAINKLAKHYDIDSDKKQFISFWMKETTRNSNRKEVQYIGTRIKLHVPTIVKRGDTETIYNYKFIVTKYDEKNFKID
jgi:hypothetical protein